jgi:hypothetical protein
VDNRGSGKRSGKTSGSKGDKGITRKGGLSVGERVAGSKESSSQSNYLFRCDMTQFSTTQVGLCQDLTPYDTDAVVSFSANLIGATAALLPTEYNDIVTNHCKHLGSNQRSEACRIYRESWDLRRVLLGDYVMVPVNYTKMKTNDPHKGTIAYCDGTRRGITPDTFVTTIAGSLKRFDTAASVFNMMKKKLGEEPKPVTTDTLLLYKKRVRGDTLTLIINRQLQFLSHKFVQSFGCCLGDCVVSSCDSSLILGGYQNTNKSGNKVAKIEKREIATLKITENPTNMETLFSRTKVAWDFLVNQNLTKSQSQSGEKIVLKQRMVLQWWRDPFLSKSLRNSAFLFSEGATDVSEGDEDVYSV